jgi:3',5'-nucleoside bisphosphate phosphatase
MSPVNIVRNAVMKKLDIIAITDHNSTRHCKSAVEIGKKNGITVLFGAEINTKEEIHCLTFFETIEKAEIFQQYLDENLDAIQNKPSLFGPQYIVDEAENILDEEKRLLIASLRTGIEEIASVVSDLNGLFIPAHINRKSNSIYSQLGFLPGSLKVDALEISPDRDHEQFKEDHPEIKGYLLISNSDAHNLDRVGSVTTRFYLEHPGFKEIRMALHGEKGRKASIA